MSCAACALGHCCYLTVVSVTAALRDSSAHIEDKVAKMSELLVHAMSSTLIGARERPARPRKIGFADKEVAGRIHVSLAQINIAVKYEKLQHAGLDSMAKVFSYFARCKNGTQSPYHDVPSLSAISEWETARQFYMSVGHFQSVPSLPLRQVISAWWCLVDVVVLF